MQSSGVFELFMCTFFKIEWVEGSSEEHICPGKGANTAIRRAVLVLFSAANFTP